MRDEIQLRDSDTRHRQFSQAGRRTRKEGSRSETFEGAAAARAGTDGQKDTRGSKDS
jgi:hypothetical protein